MIKITDGSDGASERNVYVIGDHGDVDVDDGLTLAEGIEIQRSILDILESERSGLLRNVRSLFGRQKPTGRNWPIALLDAVAGGKDWPSHGLVFLSGYGTRLSAF